MRHEKGRSAADALVDRVAVTLRRRRLAGPDDPVLVAISAGPDSTALVAVLARLRDRGAIGPLHALHVDHGLRPGGDLDAAAARETCEALGVPFASVRVRVARGNVQASARRARYAALRAAARRAGATRIATGHTLTDQAETFLLRALRGAGARGLSAIPPRRGAIVRPLIDATRQEVTAFLEGAGLAWREDPTNASPRFARNALRHAAVPILRALEPRFERALARAADLLRDDERALAKQGAALVEEGGDVPLRALRGAPRAVRRRAVRVLWRRASGRARALPAARVEEVLALCRRTGPGRLALPGGLEARVAYGRLRIDRAAAARGAEGEIEVAGPGRYGAGGLLVDVDADAGDGAIPWPLVLRGRRPGDRIRPARAPGSKKLKAWLIDRKVPREVRDALWILADGAGNVLAIPELGIRSAAAGSLRVSVRRRPSE